MIEVEQRSRAFRLALFSLGWVFFVLGIIGAILPVMPTTPFMLIALWCFARSSRRFHGWLLHHKLFGPPLQSWERHGIIPLGAKIIAIASMVVSMIYVLGFTQTPGYLLAFMAITSTIGAVFILTRPHRGPE
ncbi:MAG: YbaN family protein [Phaeospirillum sp.]|nr:YbaN family protein [Phaeospirillum sp.]